MTEKTPDGVLDRSMRILEYLAKQSKGVELGGMAADLRIPPSATHRLLSDLQRLGYVRQLEKKGSYTLTTKLAAMGLAHLSQSGVVDIAQPLLDRLADVSGELVRLAVLDGTRLTWVAKAQGAKQGLRYDPDMGQDARLSCSASGLAWLSTLSDPQALAIIDAQGIGKSKDYGPNAPKSKTEIVKILQATRKAGYCTMLETYTAGLNAMAAVVQKSNGQVLGTISIGGPSVRFRKKEILACSRALLQTCQDLAEASIASPLLHGTSHDNTHAN